MTTFEGPPLADTPEVGPLTMGGFVDEVAARRGSAEAMVLVDGLRGDAVVRWSYERLGAESRRIARGLVAHGVRPGETVGVLMGNRPEAVAGIFGAALAGAVVAPMSTFAPRPEVIDMVARSGAVAVLTQARLLGRRFGDELGEMRGDLPALRFVATVGDGTWDQLLDSGAGVDDEEVGDEELDARGAAVTPDDPALVIFSSGTTSRPKAILHAHRSPTLQFWLQASIFGRGPDTRMFSALPLFWTAGLNSAMGATLAAGGCWVMQETFDAGAALALMSSERVTEPYTLPHQAATLAEHPDWRSTDLSSLRCVYGKGAYARHPTVRPDPGWIMPVGYGLSETCAFVSGHRSDVTRERAGVGHGPLMPGARVRILDTALGTPLDVDREGEIAAAGPTVMLGYLGDCSGGLDDDGFFHTGDLGHVDRDGVLHYAGRLTEMVKTAGANVSPAEVEVQLRRFPEVKLSRVLGVPDERVGQVVVAAVVLRDGAELDAATVRSRLREHLAAYKVPRTVLFLDEVEMPMTGADHKVRDDALRDLVLHRLSIGSDGPSPAGPTTAGPTTTGGR